MKGSDSPRTTPPLTARAGLWVLSLLLVGVGARLWLIHRFGTPLPFWDQWEEARVVFTPYLDGTLTFADLLSPHNEHRIFFTRLYALGLLLVNGQFDNQVEMVANVFLYAAILAGFGGLLARYLGRGFWPLISLLLMLVLALPFAWENTLAGFHSQFYFMTLFSLLTLWLLGFHKPASLPWACGLAAAACALFTVGSGLIASAAVGGLVALRFVRKPSIWREHWPTAAACLGIIGVGLVLKVDVPHHHVLMAHSITEFTLYLAKFLAWPWIVLAPFAAFNCLPILILTCLYLRDREAQMPAEELVIGLGLWALLQAAASAYARGAQVYPQWRYMDAACFVMIANALSLALLATRYADRLPGRRYFRAATVLWVAACASGLVLLSSRALQVDIRVREIYHRLQLLTARAYLATGDLSYLQTKQREYLARFQGEPVPHPDHAKAFTDGFDAPHVRAMLPACVRAPLPMLPESASGFVTNGAATVRPQIPGELAWSSYTAAGARAKGRFESLPLPRSKFPFLEFRVAGGLGEPGLSLSVLDLRSGKSTAIEPRQAPGLEWQSCQIKAPSGDFKIIASDESESGWFAFQPPREVGGLSWLAGRVLSIGAWLCVPGVGLYLAGVVMVFRERRTAVSGTTGEADSHAARKPD